MTAGREAEPGAGRAGAGKTADDGGAGVTDGKKTVRILNHFRFLQNHMTLYFISLCFIIKIASVKIISCIKKPSSDSTNSSINQSPCE